MPIVWYLVPGTPEWAANAWIRAAEIWEEDPTTFIEMRRVEAPADASHSSCDPSSPVAAGVRSLRLTNASWVGLNSTCSSSSGPYDGENWIDPSGQPNALHIALHEFGHLLGFDHTNVPNAIMDPIVNATTTLQPDELTAIRTWYPGPFATELSSERSVEAGPLKINPGVAVPVPFAARVVGEQTCQPPKTYARVVGATGLAPGAPKDADGHPYVPLTRLPEDSQRVCRGTLILQAPDDRTVRDVALEPMSNGVRTIGHPLLFRVTANAAPTISISGPIERASGEPGQWTASVSDLDDDTAALTIEWEIDGDIGFDDGSGPTASATLTKLGLRRLTARVTDPMGRSTVAEVTVKVSAPLPSPTPKVGATIEPTPTPVRIVSIDVAPTPTPTPTVAPNPTPAPTPQPAPAAPAGSPSTSDDPARCARQQGAVGRWVLTVKGRHERFLRRQRAARRAPTSKTLKAQAASARASWRNAVKSRRDAERRLARCEALRRT